MEGSTFDTLDSNYSQGLISRQVYLNILKNCVIYARMKPENKRDLISTLKNEFKGI